MTQGLDIATLTLMPGAATRYVACPVALADFRSNLGGENVRRHWEGWATPCTPPEGGTR